MKYYLYILKSLSRSSYYIGITKDVNDRLKRHNSGQNKSTKGDKPYKLIYEEKFDNRIDAREREKYLKSYAGVGEKRKIISKFDK